MRSGTRVVVALTLLALVALGSSARSTQAAFSDAAAVTTGALTAGTVEPVTGLNCAVEAEGARFTWTGAPNRQYVVTVTGATTGVVAATTTTTATSYTVNRALLGLGTWRVSVRAVLPGTSWVAPSAPSRNVSLALNLISCP
ncbi:hypothetical protein GC722_01530 [Auraticoccus sp. F435]|uniref:Fibronectin type-III domain-containing protein n=1 Tax=Auraticoccus cholistanensis TaxID=2656650 RepID=A0A6A9UPW1_9ACTN|nr:hypothetical protein [Auraticoccus cholistanensis]MVA74721.1 hypothetical protein [Auraticoccus cholistanensis]